MYVCMYVSVYVCMYKHLGPGFPNKVAGALNGPKGVWADDSSPPLPPATPGHWGALALRAWLEVNRRLEEQGKGKDKSSGSKGKGWENSDSWWNSDDSCWYENTGYENTWWEAQEDQWQQPHWTPKGKKSGKDKKGKAKWTQ